MGGLATCAHAVSPIPQQIAPASTTCKIYALAHEFAHTIQPDITKAQSRAVWDALQLDNCNITSPHPPRGPHTAAPRDTAKTPVINDVSQTLYVDPNKGNDGASGSISAPLKTIHAAKSRA